ncbi:MAG: hypothetical protein IT314_14500 [Anaerolineales bacterium]|nr:hypothetical protein [Anaerolineales bacterium]
MPLLSLQTAMRQATFVYYLKYLGNPVQAKTIIPPSIALKTKHASGQKRSELHALSILDKLRASLERRRGEVNLQKHTPFKRAVIHMSISKENPQQKSEAS